MKQNYYLIFLIIAAYLCSTNMVSAQQAGTLDMTFDGDGVVYFNLNNPIHEVKIQPDGKIVAIANDSLYRLNPDGSRDTTFGNNGASFVPNSGNDLVVMPDGQYIVVLSYENSYGTDKIYVYYTNGTLVREVPTNTFTACFCDIIAVSNTLIRTSDCDYGDIYHYDILNDYNDVLGNGIPDAVQTCVGIEYENGHMISSHSTVYSDPQYLYIAKIGDNSFGNNGVYSESFPYTDMGGNFAQLYRRGAHLQSDDKMVYAYSYGDSYFVNKLNADGTPDPAFNQVALSGYTAPYQSFMVNSVNEIVSIVNGDLGTVHLKLISADGSQTTDFEGYIFDPNKTMTATSIAVQDDDKVLISGMLRENANEPLKGIVARLQKVIPLPIDFTTFQVYLDGKTAVLKWRTATEINNAGFEIQKSKDGIQWERIGWQEGQGTSSAPHAYTYRDTNPFFGTSYYRLKQVDLNGDFEYSNVVSLQYIRNRVTIYPNPVKDRLYLQTNDNIVERATIYDAVGKQIVQVSNPGSYLNISSLSQGIYLLKITIEGENFYEKIIVE